MAQSKIVSLGEAAAVVLPGEVLEAMGLRVGDVIDVTVGDRELILRPAAPEGSQSSIEEIVRELFERRGDAYRRLA
jgi:antitoxin component of MazEF toxin-antitoxin module